MFSLPPPRHISTLPIATKMGCPPHVCFSVNSDRTADIQDRQLRAIARHAVRSIATEISSCRLSSGNIETDYINPFYTSANWKPP